MKKQFLNYAIISTLLISLNVTLQAESNLTFKGDIRLRSQYETQGENTRLRERIRFRLGASKELSEQTTVTFGLATGSSDARSTNQTFDNSFETPDIRFDYAYITQAISDSISLQAGRMKNPIWTPSDLLWDSDINPNGLSVNYNHSNYKIVSGLFRLEENSNGADPLMVILQPQLKWNLAKDITVKNALGLYLTNDVKESNLTGTAGTNTNATTALPNEFLPIVVSTQADIINRFGFELIRPFGELVYNTNVDSKNKGALVGLAFGNKKVSGLGKWQSKLSYRYLQADAWLDILPDSNSYGGATNTKGFELIFKYGLTKNMSLALDYYIMDVIEGSSNSQSLAQLDLNVKF